MKETSKQVGETQARWAWVEPCAWTENMLTALEKGVKGGQWFSLIDKVWDEDALWEVDRLLGEGNLHVLEVDFKKYFDSIPREPLVKQVGERISDGRMLPLIEKFLQQGVMEEGRRWEPEEGTPQGSVISPLLANIYLHPLDQSLRAAGYKPIRFADDLVVVCRSREEAEGALSVLMNWAAESGLPLHPQKTRIVDMREHRAYFEFLGYRIQRTRKERLRWWPRPKSMTKLKDQLRVETRRANGRSLQEIIRRINLKLRGWFEYFKHSIRPTFETLDGWVRMRLRSILRKRQGRRGRGRGQDQRRWPNAYFAEQGLFSTLTAHQYACQSARR